MAARRSPDGEPPPLPVIGDRRFAGKLGNQLRVPLTIVPGALSEAEIDAIS